MAKKEQSVSVSGRFRHVEIRAYEGNQKGVEYIIKKLIEDLFAFSKVRCRRFCGIFNIWWNKPVNTLNLN